MRLAAPSSPTIWPPRSRPLRRSAISLTVMGLAPGSSRHGWCSRRGGHGAEPAASASRSLSPVRATSVAQILVTAVPTHAGEGRVAAAHVDAGHAALLVGDVPRAMWTGRRGHEVVRLAQSPAAHTPSAWCAGAGRPAMAPLATRARCPASRASSTLGIDAEPDHHEIGGDGAAGGVHLPLARSPRPRRRCARRRRSAGAHLPPDRPCRDRGCDITCVDASTRTTVAPAFDERLGHLQADVAAADDDHVAAP